MNKVVKYIKNEQASEAVVNILILVVGVAAVGVFGYMVYSAIKSGQKAMGEDFVQGG